MRTSLLVVCLATGWASGWWLGTMRSTLEQPSLRAAILPSFPTLGFEPHGKQCSVIVDLEDVTVVIGPASTQTRVCLPRRTE